MLLRRQKARQLEQKVRLGLELAPAFPGVWVLPTPPPPSRFEERATAIWVFWGFFGGGLLHLY